VGGVGNEGRGEGRKERVVVGGKKAKKKKTKEGGRAKKRTGWGSWGEGDRFEPLSVRLRKVQSVFEASFGMTITVCPVCSE